MIIACPACATRYVVPDSAIGVEGRTVRCAKCRHSWFQDGPELEMPEASPAPAPSAAAAAAPPARNVPPAASPEAEPDEAEPPETGHDEPEVPPVEEPDRADDIGAEDEPVPEPPNFAPRETPIEEAAEQETATPSYEGEVSHFEHEPPFRPRRNILKLWTAAAAIFAVLALGTVATVSYFGLPDWVPISKPTFALAEPDLVLDFPPGNQDRRTLPNGTEFFGASGTVTNVGRTSRDVPPILIVLRDARDRIVYSWEVAPPKRTLAPGEAVTINEAVTDVPRSAKFAEIGWKPS